MKASIQNRVKKTLEKALATDKNRAALTKALTELVKQFAHDETTAALYGAWLEGSDLVVDYQPPTSPLAAGITCAPTIFAP